MTMRTRKGTWIAFSLLGVVTASGCSPFDADSTVPVHDCQQDLQYSPSQSEWMSWEMSVEHSEPRKCPVKIDYAGQWVNTAGVVWERGFLYFLSAYLRVYNSDNVLQAWIFDNFHYDPTTQDYYAQVSTSYPSVTGSLYRDRMRYEMEPSPYPWASIDITYQDCPLCM